MAHPTELAYKRLLVNIVDIPIATFTQAMRIAVKYSMNDVQVAIAKAVGSNLLPGLHTRIARLAFVAEFPSHFSKDFAIKVFTDASIIDSHPTVDDLEPLIAYPAFIALMMQYREGLCNSDKAIWKKTLVRTFSRQMEPMNERMWLNVQFGSFGFKP
jgi:hypothetical protein